MKTRLALGDVVVMEDTKHHNTHHAVSGMVFFDTLPSFRPTRDSPLQSPLFRSLYSPSPPGARSAENHRTAKALHTLRLGRGGEGGTGSGNNEIAEERTGG